MKKLLLTILVFLSLTLTAQDNDVTRFMGIPIDGSKTEMISKLKKKGFSYDLKKDCLSGEFNGSNVDIYIVTNKNKVYRIFVADKQTFSEAQIKIRFNNLVYQFEHNKNYHHNQEIDQYIKEDEDISYQMLVNNKCYDASFYQKGEVDPVDIASYISSSIDTVQYDTILYEKLHNAAIDVCNSLGDTYYEDYYLPEINNLSRTEVFEYDKSFLKSIVLALELTQQFNRIVWFRIFEQYGKYYIGIYYDNMKNASNGEDL